MAGERRTARVPSIPARFRSRPVGESGCAGFFCNTKHAIRGRRLDLRYRCARAGGPCGAAIALEARTGLTKNHPPHPVRLSASFEARRVMLKCAAKQRLEARAGHLRMTRARRTALSRKEGVIEGCAAQTPSRGEPLCRSAQASPVSLPDSHSANGHVRNSGKQARLHQVGIELTHAACVLPVAVFHELPEVEPVQKHVRLGYREIPAIVRFLSPPHHAEQPPCSTAIEPCRFHRARQRDMSTMLLTPGHVVDEKDDVPRLLAHQDIENLKHPLGQKFRLTRGLESAESKKRVQTLAETEIDEGRFEIGRERLERLLCRLQSVAIDHHANELGVTALLDALQCDGFAHHRIDHLWRKRVDDCAGAALGVVHFLPERYTAQSCKRRFFQIRPWQFLWVEHLMCFDELPAK